MKLYKPKDEYRKAKGDYAVDCCGGLGCEKLLVLERASSHMFFKTYLVDDFNDKFEENDKCMTLSMRHCESLDLEGLVRFFNELKEANQ
jgi:hypothetical protein